MLAGGCGTACGQHLHSDDATQRSGQGNPRCLDDRAIAAYPRAECVWALPLTLSGSISATPTVEGKRWVQRQRAKDCDEWQRRGPL